MCIEQKIEDWSCRLIAIAYFVLFFFWVEAAGWFGLVATLVLAHREYQEEQDMDNLAETIGMWLERERDRDETREE